MGTDPSSPDFNPLLALYSAGDSSTKDVKAYDNIASFEASLKRQQNPELIKNAPGTSKRDQKSFSQKKRREEEAKNRDVGKLKELMEMREKMDKEIADGATTSSSQTKRKPTRTRFKKKRTNLLTSMEKLSNGPHSLLYKIVRERLRCNAYVRDFCGIRGVCSGYVVAFDRFMNLGMVDVDETFRKAPVGKVAEHQKPLTVSLLKEATLKIAHGELGAPRTSGKKSNDSKLPRVLAMQMQPDKGPSVKSVGKDHFCHEVFHGGLPQLYHRHLPHLLLRGDSIVMICIK